MKICTIIVFAVCLVLFVGAHPTPKRSEEDSVSKIDINRAGLKLIIKDIVENMKIDDNSEEKDEIIYRFHNKIIMRKDKNERTH
ncbi:hypothetical protein H8356DRAFT_1745125 [Neocallimastix lanati (nom. inval.)]|nr:hypothetical protein H8356DRAFT_1745125 [Neocallimastix sp. JGI-2020a]